MSSCCIDSAKGIAEEASVAAPYDGRVGYRPIATTTTITATSTRSATDAVAAASGSDHATDLGTEGSIGASSSSSSSSSKASAGDSSSRRRRDRSHNHENMLLVFGADLLFEGWGARQTPLGRYYRSIVSAHCFRFPVLLDGSCPIGGAVGSKCHTVSI